jgi:hypothetical protein
MLGTTNSRFQDFCGSTAESFFSTSNKIFWFGSLHTSYVTECKINENIMTIKTRNSEYTFELLEGTEFEQFKRTPEQILEMENLCR